MENAFGILSNPLGFLTNLRQEPQNLETMVLACVTLHNMPRTACTDDGSLGDRENEQNNLVPGSWRDDAVLDDFERRLYVNNTSRAAKFHGSCVWCSDGAVQCLLIVNVGSPFHKHI